MISAGSYAAVEERFKGARRGMVIGGLVTATTIAIFAWAVAKEDSPAPPEFRVPVEGQFTISSEGKDSFEGILPESCLNALDAVGTIPVIVLSSKGGVHDIVVVPTDSCPQPVRLTIEQPTDGRVIPAQPVEITNPPPTATPTS